MSAPVKGLEYLAQHLRHGCEGSLCLYPVFLPEKNQLVKFSIHKSIPYIYRIDIQSDTRGDDYYLEEDGLEPAWSLDARRFCSVSWQTEDQSKVTMDPSLAVDLGEAHSRLQKRVHVVEVMEEHHYWVGDRVEVRICHQQMMIAPEEMGQKGRYFEFVVLDSLTNQGSGDGSSCYDC